MWEWEVRANHPIWSSPWHVVPKSILYAPFLCGIHGLPFWSFIKVRGHLLCAPSAPRLKWRHVLCGSVPASPSLHLPHPFEQPMGHNWRLTLRQGAWPFCFQSYFTLKTTCTSCCSGVIVETLTIHQDTGCLHSLGRNILPVKGTKTFH